MAVEDESATRRRELADFLRTRRAGLAPGDVGLPDGARRRTPGLRREEVAALAGVGTTWYTWLEQARDVRASRSVLEAIGGALRLTPAERRHLLRLGRGEDVAPAFAHDDETVDPALARMIELLGPNPAYILGYRWDYLAYNAALVAVFGDPAGLPEGRRNHVWWMFTDPSRRALSKDYMSSMRMIVARFRADAARHVDDPGFAELVRELSEASELFRRLWDRHEVAGDSTGRKELVHPEAGELAFEHAVLRPADAPEQRLVIYTPRPEHDTASKVEALVAAAR